MHLYGETLEQYFNRDLPAPQLASIDEHVSNCLFCTYAFAEANAASERWERRGWLGRLVRVVSEPPVDQTPGEELERAA